MGMNFCHFGCSKIPKTSPNCALSRRDGRGWQDVAPGTARTRYGREDAANSFPTPRGCSPCSPLPESRQRGGDARQHPEPLAPWPCLHPLLQIPCGQRQFAAFSPELVTNFPIPIQSVGGDFPTEQRKGGKKCRRWNFQGKCAGFL